MKDNECIRSVCDRLKGGFSPEKIILFSTKYSISGRMKSFKLCLVTDTRDKAELEKNIYLTIDCDIPFDVLVYTPDEWATLTGETDSFANRIKEEGTYVYGSEEKG